MKLLTHKQISYSLKAPALLASAVLTFAFTPLAAEQTIQVGQEAYYMADDGNQRINLSGRLRMLSQRIPGMACNCAAGIETAASEANLAAAVEEFSVILAGLQVGDPDLEIYGPEDSRRILNGINQLQERWEPIETLAADVLARNAENAAVDELAASSLPLLTDAQILVGRIVERHYDHVFEVQSEAFTIDFAGRQRMLLQQMSKNICLLHTETATEQTLQELEKGYALFDATLTALQNGMPEVGVLAPLNETVADGLQVVDDGWTALNPLLQRAMAGEKFDEATRVQLFHDLNALTGKMNETVKMYVQATAPESA